MEDSKCFIQIPRNELKNRKLYKTVRFLNKMKKTFYENQINYYGLFRKDKFIQFCCLIPKICFDSISKENPYKMIFTSGSLADKSIMEEVTNLTFQKHHIFKLPNYRNQCYLATKSKVGTTKLILNYINKNDPNYK